MDLNPDLIYHQKLTLVENIIRYVHKYKAKSLLDIGAGLPETAVPISHSVDTYLAIEQDAESVKELKAVNIDVIQSRFPVTLNRTFDLVLSSHSIPELSLNSYSSFLSKSWELINPEGHFLIVTFKGNSGALKDVRQELFNSASDKSLEYDAVIAFLETQEKPSIERINSYIQAKSGETMADFLAPWIFSDSDKLAEKMPHLLHILNTRHKVKSNLFVFPTEHLFISCKKPKF